MSVRGRAAAVFALVLVLGYLGLANLAGSERRASAWWLPDEGLRLGLDLQGGIHMVIAPDLAVAIEQELTHLDGLLEKSLDDEGIQL